MHAYDSKEPELMAPVALEKRCSGPCGRLLPLDAFGRHRKAKDGLNWWCRICARARACTYYATHKDELKARAIACRVVVTQKCCCACDEWLPVSSFQRTTRTKDGYQSWCRACRRTYDAAHRAKKATYDRAYAVLNAERHRVQARLWRARNADRLRADRQRHAADNSARVMRYYRANPEPFKVRANERRMRLRRIPGHYTATDVQMIRDAQRGRCAYCGTALAANSPIEHMTPVTRGGTNWPCNLCLACRSCNQRKFTKTAGEYLALLVRGRRL